MRVMSLSRVAALLSICAACGSSDASPSAAPAAPTPPQVAGVWQGTLRLIGASGGDCVGPLYQGVIGTAQPMAVSVTQSGVSLSGTATFSASGVSCNLTGSVGSNGAFTWTGNGCSVAAFSVRCVNGLVRDVYPVTASGSGSFMGNSVSGSWGETYNVDITGTQTSVAVLTLNATFALTR
jgi:hypothetical protein